MKVPEGMTFHAAGGPYQAGDAVPDELIAALPSDHPLKALRSARPAPAPVDKV
jgi:hypothetical protein